MKRLIIALAALLAAAVAIVMTLPLMVSAEMVRDQVTRQARTLAGYEMRILGEAELSFFPRLRFTIHDVTLHPPGDGEQLAEIDVLSGSLSLVSLLFGEVDAGTLTLTRPRLTLEVDAEGRPNWTPADDSLIANALSGPARFAATDIRLGDLVVEDGAVSHMDRETGRRVEASDIGGRLSWPDLASPLSAKGAAVWNGQRVAFEAGADAPTAFVQQGETPLSLSLSAALATVAFDGRAVMTTDPQLDGRLMLSTDSAREMLRWLGSDLGAGAGLNALEIEASLALLGRAGSLSGMRLSIDGNRAEGSLKVDIGQEPFSVQGTLAFESLDLDTYRSSESDQAEDEENAELRFLTRPLDLDLLDRLAADIRLSAGSVRLGGVALGQAAATVTVRDGALSVGVGEARMFGGHGMGTITLHQSAAGPRAEVTGSLNSVAAMPLLQATTGLERVEGTAHADVDLAATGGTVGEMVTTLSGQTRLRIVDGALRGVDIAGAIDSLGSGRMEGWPLGADARTGFGNVDATFRIADGVASTDRFSLAAPALGITARGDIDLMAAEVSGEGTATLTRSGDTEDLEVPFVIRGPVRRPLLYPRPDWLIERAGGDDAAERIRRGLDSLRDDERVEELMRRGMERLPGLFGGSR